MKTCFTDFTEDNIWNNPSQLSPNSGIFFPAKTRKNLWMAAQNISESQIKTHLTIFKHSKKFSFGF